LSSSKDKAAIVVQEKMDESLSDRSAVLVPPCRSGSIRTAQPVGSFKGASASDEVPPRDSPTTRPSTTRVRIISDTGLREMVVGNGQEHGTKQAEAVQQGVRPVENEMKESDIQRYFSLLLSRLRRARLQNRNQHSNSTMPDDSLLPHSSTKKSVKSSEPSLHSYPREVYISSLRACTNNTLTSTSKSHLHPSADPSKKTPASDRVAELMELFKKHYNDKDPELEKAILLELNLSEDSEGEAKNQVMNMQQLRNKLCCSSSLEPILEGSRLVEANQASSMENVLSPPCSRRCATTGVHVAESPAVIKEATNHAPNNTFLHQVSALLTCTTSEDVYNDGTESLFSSSGIDEMNPRRAVTFVSTDGVYDMSTQQQQPPPPALFTTVAQTPQLDTQPRQPVITVTDLGLFISCGAGGCFERSTAASSDMDVDCMNDNNENNVGGANGCAHDKTLRNNNNHNTMMMRQNHHVCPTSVVWEEGELRLDDLSILTEEEMLAARRGQTFMLGEKFNRLRQAATNKGLQTNKNAAQTQQDQVLLEQSRRPSVKHDKREKSKLQRRLPSWSIGKSKTTTTSNPAEKCDKPPCRQWSSTTTRGNDGDNEVELVCSPASDKHDNDFKDTEKDQNVHDAGTDSEVTTVPSMTSEGPYEVQLAIVAIAGQDDDEANDDEEGEKGDDEFTDVTTGQGDRNRLGGHILMKQLMTSWRQPRAQVSLVEL
jgi:hypothetical protein